MTHVKICQKYEYNIFRLIFLIQKKIEDITVNNKFVVILCKLTRLELCCTIYVIAWINVIIYLVLWVFINKWCVYTHITVVHYYLLFLK